MNKPKRSNKSKSVSLPRGIVIRQHKHSASLQVYFSYRGVDCRETLKLEPTSSNIKYADRLRGEILNAIEHGSFRYSNYFPESKRAKLFGEGVSNETIGVLLTNYLDLCEKTLQPSTVRGYKEVSKAHLFPQFRHIRIRDLTPAMLRTWISGLGLTTKRVRNILTPLRAVLEQAVNDDMIPANPLDKVVLNKLLDRETRISKFIVDPFDQHEIQSILKTAQGQVRNLFQFAFFSGLRTSELIALEWGDIDWVNNFIRVSRAVVEKQEKSTKTRAGIRNVLILPPALEALKNQKSHTYLQDGKIFFNPKTDNPWETDAQIRKTAWTHALKKAGVRYRNPYQTRHTYASTLLSSGENPWWVAEQMGHETIEMIMRHYGRWIPDKSKKSGYQPVNDWGAIWEANCTDTARSKNQDG